MKIQSYIEEEMANAIFSREKISKREPEDNTGYKQSLYSGREKT